MKKILPLLALMLLIGCKREKDESSANPLHSYNVIQGTWKGDATVSGNTYQLTAWITDKKGVIEGQWNTYQTDPIPAKFLSGNGEMDPHTISNVTGTYDGAILRATVSGTANILDGSGNVVTADCPFTFDVTGAAVSGGGMSLSFTGTVCGNARSGTGYMAL